jgi:translocator protein
MTGLASPSQLRMSFLRWALVTIPLLVFLGFLSGASAGSGENNAWYQALSKPWFNPPGWVFPVAWTVLYVLMGLALAMVLHARGNRNRAIAITLFAVQFAINLCWSPLFFAAHQVFAAFILVLFMLAAAIATTFAFGRVRTVAAWLMVPYLVWISFAGILNYTIHTLNPGAETLAPAGRSTQIDL